LQKNNKEEAKIIKEIFQKLEETDFESEQSRREREYEQMRSIENCNKMRRLRMMRRY
tara:strand:- start:552 stop:722 length:171 start_codon:yes stop_codon:yes gene_type:complete